MPWLKSFGQGDSAASESAGPFHVLTILWRPFDGTVGVSRSIRVSTSENHTLEMSAGKASLEDNAYSTAIPPSTRIIATITRIRFLLAFFFPTAKGSSLHLKLVTHRRGGFWFGSW